MINDMNSNYAYSYTVHPDEIVYCDTDRICMFGINPFQLDSFSMGTNENSKNILISHDITSEERKRLERKRKEKKMKKKRMNRSH